MRRFVLFLAASVPLFAATGCEDGPNQTYSPAPAGAATIWNGSAATGGLPEAGISVGNGTEGYDASFGGTNANITCTADQAKAIWSKYFAEPILPPGLGAGLDMAGGYNGDGASGWQPNTNFTYDPSKETWVGATVEQAEKILCNGIADSIFYGITSTIGWGNGCPGLCEVSGFYYSNSRIIHDLLFQTGYEAPLPATSADGHTVYNVSLNNVPITKTVGGATTQIIIDWSHDSGTPNAYGPIVNELYDAIRASYTPQFPSEPDCEATKHCIVGNNYTEGGYFWFVPQGIAIFVNNTLAAQPAASSFTLLDLIALKLMPWSLGQVTLKLDAAGQGPIVTTPDIATSGTTGVYSLGMTWSDFDSQILEPTGAPMAVNLASKAKAFGGLGHSDESYDFNIVGIDPQYVAASLAPTAVIADGQKPAGTDVAYEFNVDQQALGSIANDFPNNDSFPATSGGTPPSPDLHGLGMVTIEWANLVQTYMRNNYGVTSQLGDAGCIATCVAGGTCKPTGGTGKCSGIEGVLTTAPAALVPAGMAANAQGAGATAIEPQYASGLKLGTWVLDFCSDLTVPTCVGGSYGGPLGGFYFDSMQNAVAVSFGSNPIPTTLASRRFYFQQWILAVIKYLQTADNPNATLAQIDANPIDDNQLFFDSAGGGFENGNYIFRGGVNAHNQAPTILNVSTNLTTSVLNNYTFARYNFRGDKALYTALTTNASDQLGAEPLYLSNLAGSPVLQGVYGGAPPAPADGGTPVTPYQCATDTTGALGCATGAAPVDPITGQPLYAPYAGAFGASVLNIAANGASPTPSAMTVDATDFELIQSANVTLPIWSDPYDPTSATPMDKTISVLLPYYPKSANIGFPVTIDGSRDKFYNTNEVVFTGAENLAGTNLEATVDYEYVPLTGADGGLYNALIVRAIETQSFLGLLFACSQPSPTVPGATDILAVRMYQNVNDILSWLSTHPGAAAGCGLEIKYSPYGNYADYISFLTNGVRIGFNPGFGGSVASDGTLFDPNVVASLGQ